MDREVIRTYVEYFLPREVLGPVVLVFSLEGVIDGVFRLFVPQAYATLGWAIVFVGSFVLVALWGAADEEDREELEAELEEIREGE